MGLVCFTGTELRKTNLVGTNSSRRTKWEPNRLWFRDPQTSLELWSVTCEEISRRTVGVHSSRRMERGRPQR